MSFAPWLHVSAQTEGADSSTSFILPDWAEAACLAAACDSAGQTTPPYVDAGRATSPYVDAGQSSSPYVDAEQTVSPRSERARVRDSIYWSHVPADCHIQWRRHRERPFYDFCMDLAHYFNTYDTTYVERNRYNFRVMAMNTDFFQVYRLAGRASTDDGLSVPVHQFLTFAPDHAVKVGLRAGWRWLVVGYTFGVVPNTGHKASELNFAAYNSRLGCDFNWQHSSGPFVLRRARGFEGVPNSFPQPTVEGIKTNTVGANVYYVFNYRHFSYPAAYNACTVQLRSAGSWLVGGSYDYQQFNFDPDEAERVIQGLATPSPLGTAPTLIDALRVPKVNYHRLGVSLGYGYNWVPCPGLLVSASISPSVGFKKQVGVDITKHTIVDNIRWMHLDAIFRAAVVYNRQRWFVGASAVSYLYDYRQRDFSLNNNVTYLKAFVGVQFHKRKKFRLATDRSKW